MENVCVHLCESVDHSRELQWNQPNLDYKNLLNFLCLLAPVVLWKIVLKSPGKKSQNSPFIIEVPSPLQPHPTSPHPQGMCRISTKNLHGAWHIESIIKDILILKQKIPFCSILKINPNANCSKHNLISWTLSTLSCGSISTSAP